MSLVSEWIKVGNEFYRKQELYSLDWGIGNILNDLLISGAQFGGPIAVTRDATKFTRADLPGKPVVFIFSCSGKKISSFKWTSGYLLAFGWSTCEDLICIQEDGTVLLYDMFGNYKTSFNMGQEAKDAHITSAVIFSHLSDTGIAVLTKSNRVFLVNNVNDHRTRKYSSLLSTEVTCWCIIRQDRNTKVLVCQGSSIYLLSHSDNQPEVLNVSWEEPGGIPIQMAVSASLKHIAILSDTGILWIGSSDISVKYLEYNTKMHTKPRQIVWCGSEVVILLWESSLELVSISGSSANYYVDGFTFLIQDVDAVRAIGHLYHDLFQKVSHVTVETLGIGSREPSALLLEAFKCYQEENVRANDYLGIVKDNIREAVFKCIEASQHEYQSDIQKILLQAALFGKSFASDIDAEHCKTVMITLRILNALRERKIGIPLTWTQFESLTMPVLIDRLVARRLFPLALAVASFLKLPEIEGASRILAHWACYKVLLASQKSEEQIARDINEKLGYTPGISYTDIANHAEKAGRKSLAIKLLEYEYRPCYQVPVLLKFGEDKTALLQAQESGDTDLINIVLYYLHEKLSLIDFLMLVRKYPVAQALYIKNCRENDIDQYRYLLVQEDDFHKQGVLKLSEASTEMNTRLCLTHLQGAVECFKNSHNEFNQQTCDEQIKLIKWQVKLEESECKPYLNKSLHDTIYQLIEDGKFKESEKLKSEFKMSDKKYWLLRIDALAKNENWEELSNFSKVKKTPVGFEPFVDICLKYKKSEAVRYAQQVKGSNKVPYLVKCGLFEEAADVAFESKNTSDLQHILGACGNQHQVLQVKIKQFLQS